MLDYSYETVWPRPSTQVREEAIDFWRKEAALSEGKTRERASQLLVICREPAGGVAGISTAQPTYVSVLGLECFYFRSFVGRAHRVRGLRSSRIIHQLVHASYGALNERFQRGIDAQVVGLYLEIESRSIQRHRNELVWTDDGANVVFIGVLPDGLHARVWYFDKAKRN